MPPCRRSSTPGYLPRGDESDAAKSLLLVFSLAGKYALFGFLFAGPDISWQAGRLHHYSLLVFFWRDALLGEGDLQEERASFRLSPLRSGLSAAWYYQPAGFQLCY